MTTSKMIITKEVIRTGVCDYCGSYINEEKIGRIFWDAKVNENYMHHNCSEEYIESL